LADKFDCIVVGAGPAGCAAAITMARAGLNVVIVERGDYPGAKNVMGGIMYRQPTEEIVPNFSADAPVERGIVKQGLWMLAEDSAVTFMYQGGSWSKPPYNAYSVLRAKFDPWFAQQAEEAGAFLITETTVTDLIWEGGRVVGVQTSRDQGDLYADVVILAEGVNNLITQKNRLGEDLKMNEAALAVKEVIALRKGVIEDRFNLEDGEGVAYEALGAATRGMFGMGWLYTNKDSVSIGVGIAVSHLVQSGLNPNEVLESFKSHPAVKPLLEGGETKEYSAKLIPEGGIKSMPQVYTDGLLIVGDAARLVNAVHREGSNLALMSGKMAAETVIEAKELDDFSARVLKGYHDRLKASFILQDLAKYENFTDFFEQNTQFFTLYPELLNRAAEEFGIVDGTPKKEKQAKILQMIREKRPFWRILSDMVRLSRALGVP